MFLPRFSVHSSTLVFQDKLVRYLDFIIALIWNRESIHMKYNEYFSSNLERFPFTIYYIFHYLLLLKIACCIWVFAFSFLKWRCSVKDFVTCVFRSKKKQILSIVQSISYERWTHPNSQTSLSRPSSSLPPLPLLSYLPSSPSSSRSLLSVKS